MRTTLALFTLCAGLFSGCTMNVYHVMQTENRFYLLPPGNLDEDQNGIEPPDGAGTVLTSTNSAVRPVPEHAPRHI